MLIGSPYLLIFLIILGTSSGSGGSRGSGSGCSVSADIGFLFDASNNNNKKEEFFKKYIEFAKQLMKQHKPSKKGYHYGAVTYANKGKLEFSFEK